MSLNEVLSQKATSPYYRPPPLHILVVEMTDQKRVLSWEFEENSATPGVVKINKLTAITDGKSVAKFSLFEEFGSKIQTGECYIMKGYSLRGQSPPLAILVTKQTLFFRASNINAPEGIIKAAMDLVHPSSILKPLSDCPETKGFVSIQGKVIEISTVKKVTSKREQIPFRTILLEQEKKTVSLSLWREAAVTDVPLGASVTATHLKCTRGDYGIRLQTTSFTKIEVEVSGTLERAEIIGVMEGKEKGVLSLLLASDMILEIDEKLWQPLDHLLKTDKVMVDIEKTDNTVTAISLAQGKV